MYKWRHLVENYFQRLKEFRHIATRCDKTDTSLAAAIYIAAPFSHYDECLQALGQSQRFRPPVGPAPF